jgi:uncharacterized cofD-like protein
MCIAALADDESLVTQLFQYRFGSGAEAGASALTGHSFGNLFIAAMAELTGSFEKAVIESSRVVASQGRILPSTLRDVTLCAEFRDSLSDPAPDNMARSARGESSIGKTGRAIERVWLEPNDPPAFPDAVRAILEADVVVLGPGSLYTSVLPNALVRGIAEALGQTRAPVVYVCNVATEAGETDGYSLDQHVDALERHIGRGIIDIVVANDRIAAGAGPEIVRPSNGLAQSSARVIQANVVDEAAPDRHDPRKLGTAIMGIIRPS